jgi:zinc/manganese transport system substrate-binding protein
MNLLRLSRQIRALALSAVLVVTLVACGGADPTPEAEPEPQPEAPASGEEGAEPAAAGPLVVVTTSILGDIVQTLIGDDGSVEVLMPAGVDPHGFEPSARDAATLREADLVIANGLMLEENLIAALAAAEEDGVRVFELAPELDPIDFDWDGPHAHGHDHDDHGDEEAHGHEHEDHGDEEGHGHEHEDHGHEEGNGDDDNGHAHGPEDPHIWFDPVRMATGVQLIAAEIAAVDEALDPQEWERRGEEYAEMLLELHEELEEILGAVPAANRQLVTNHDALGYLAVRYDFEVLGTVIPGSTTQVETDARSFAQLIETVDAAGVPAIFAENTDSVALADQLASEVLGRSDLQVDVVRIYTDALGEPGSGAETYPGLLRTTATLIAEALS